MAPLLSCCCPCVCVCVCVCSVADLRKQFEREPLSTAVELQSTAQLQCLPPVGEPPPQVSLAPCTFSHSACVSIDTFLFLRKLCVQRYAWSVVLTVMFVGFILVTNVCDSAPPRKPPGRHLAFLASPSGVRGLSDRIALQRFVPWRWVRVRVRDILICLWPSLADDDSPGGCIVLAHSLPWRRVWIRVRNFIKF